MDRDTEREEVSARRGGLGWTRVRLEDGRWARVPASALEVEEVPAGQGEAGVPGTETRPDEGDDVVSREVTVIPVVAEALEVEKHLEEHARVRVHKKVSAREEVVDVPLLREDLDVRRVPIGREVDGPVEVRHEGEVTIIPVVEERLVVEKRLFLREELHVTRRRTSSRNPRRVTLRREEVRVERAVAEPVSNTSPDGGAPAGVHRRWEPHEP